MTMTGRYLYTTRQFFYAGELVEVGDFFLHLKDVVRIYDTGPTHAKHWNEAEYVGEWSIARSEITGCGPTTKTIKPDETRQDGEESAGDVDVPVVPVVSSGRLGGVMRPRGIGDGDVGVE